jgi:hypothetical protein
MKQILLIFITLLIISCSTKNDFEIREFNPLSNFNCASDTLILPMDMSDAIIDGITIPSKKQCTNGYFKISFEIINKSNSPRSYCYKIYYQNESYKFNEYINLFNSFKYNEKSGSNFYGSWDKPFDNLHITGIIPNDNKSHIVTDSFRILGNPRNELKYFGAQTTRTFITQEMIKQTFIEIKNSIEWSKGIKEKSAKNNISIDEQMYLDALWFLNDKSQKGSYNNRWKRNPRVGKYSFILAVSIADQIDQLPETIKNIEKSNNGEFKNPYFDLLYNKNLIKNRNLSIVKSKKVLKTYARFDLGSGIFIDIQKLNTFKIDSSFYSNNCGSSNKIFKTAQFEQFFHNINKNYKIRNIPVTKDIIEDNYTQDEYKNNSIKYRRNDLIMDFVQTSKSPGKTVCSNIKDKILSMKIPGNKSTKFIKEDVAINSRIGFTYGKFIAKIKFPAIINKENVWNGLTCAYWLKFQDTKDWDNRTICDSLGYISKSDEGPNSTRLKTTYYSEIDFEILKTSKYWPSTSYSNVKIIPHDDPKANHNIIVTCTNWDMACRSPKNFNTGAKEFTFDDKQYILHRWDDWYKALTIKYEINHDSIFNKPIFYEIDWQPEKIIWRIGPDKNKMIIVGYMDNTVTTIPDNQMVIVFSQEFHDSKWWPLSPFIQDLIPFPKNDIICDILELEIE